ncbi:MAG: PAS domain S-box protein, partial [Bacteroidales bacterium]|nr:PAS domain S-box protein [Bacteroidales bacterium]
MRDSKNKSRKELLSEIENLKKQIADVQNDNLFQKLKDSEEKYKTNYEHVPLSYQSLDFDGNFLDINPAWLKTLAYSKQEVIGKNFADFLHPDYKPHFFFNFQQFKEQGYIHDVQFKIQHKDGHFLDIAFEGSIAYTPEGNFKQTYCTFKDITKQKKIENALKESEERYRNLLETAPVGIAVHQDGLAVYINRKGCEIIKADSPDQIIGKPINQFIPDSVFDKVKLQVKEILKGKKHITPVEEQLICLDGTHVDVDISAMPIKYNKKLAVQI